MLPQKSTKLIIRITQGSQLWYFNGFAAPTGFTDGSTQITLTASGRTTGTFKWDVIAGADKVHLEGDTTSVTKTNVNTVVATGIGASTLAKDVTIRLTYGTQTATRKLEVRTPHRLRALVPAGRVDFSRGDPPCDITNPTDQGSGGYVSFIGYEILEQFGGLVRNAGGTELLGAKSDIQTNNWTTGTAFSFSGADGGIVDAICLPRTRADGVPFSPAPQSPPLNPSSISDVNPIDVTPQQWIIGSLLQGNNVLVQTNNITRYIDHARHKNIVSPVNP